MTPKNPAAFPFCKAVETNGIWNEVLQEGMSLRDYFAGQAIIGLLSSPNLNKEWIKNLSRAEQGKHLSNCAYHLADAILAEREKKE